MPLIQSRYHPRIISRNNYLQTIFPAMFRRSPKQSWERERWDTPDGDFFDVDWIRNPESRKLLVVLHGLEGNAQRPYVGRSAAYFALRGYEVACMNLRSCSGEDNRTLRLYHSGDTLDLSQFLETLDSRNRYDSIFMLGFSLGGNIILKYLGESGHRLPVSVHGAVAYSVPCDMVESGEILRAVKNRIYILEFLRTLKPKILRKEIRFPGMLDYARIKTCRDLYELDEHFTAPAHGFRDAQDYYLRSGCLGYLDQITTPCLLVNASNDTFLSRNSFPVEIARSSEYLHLEIPRFGGHIGFQLGYLKEPYYMESRAYAFLESCLLP